MNKRKANEELRRKMNKNLKENKKQFQKEIDRCRSKVCVRSNDELGKFDRMPVIKDVVVGGGEGSVQN